MVGDPLALLEIPSPEGMKSVLILRDIEMQRARQKARADAVGERAARQLGLMEAVS